MKLLLTSAGFTNKSIINALGDLVEKPFNELNLAFIPTAANVELGDKSWLIQDYVNCQKLHFKQIDIVDIAVTTLERLNSADILFFGGGNAYYLMSWINKSGLQDVLPEMLKTKIYVGLSAGSMVVSKWWSGKIDNFLYDEDPNDPEKYDCLGYYGFHIIPHLNLKDFPNVNLKDMKKISREIKDTTFVLDDNSAVKVVEDTVEVVSEGEWKRFN